MATIDLSTHAWTLEGWRPFSWRLMKKTDSVEGMAAPDVGPVPARVPGSVQQALLDAGVLADWNVGVQSRACEWVEHRHWCFETTLPAGTVSEGERAILAAEGLDYSGWILIDCVEAATFSGALIPHRIDLSDALNDGKAHRLSIVFDEPPREQGQMGYTSLSRWFKPRYAYSWDWCPRIVPVGVWDMLRLETGATACFEVAKVRAALDEDCCTGHLHIVVDVNEPVPPGCTLVASFFHNEYTSEILEFAAKPGPCTFDFDGLAVAPWWPNGFGSQRLYRLELRAADPEGNTLWRADRRVGFRRIEWRACEDAPGDAEPWICVVNGAPVFLQGANWVPSAALYPDVTEPDYQTLIALYRDMGCAVLRVWGGAILEKEAFYRYCDEAGILVWQEFPLSSSGVENYPPEEPGAIETLRRIATSYIHRRAHHASLLLWCGGNELTERTPDATPVTYAHPCIAALKDVVEQEDPGRRFIPTSSSGPMFYAHAANYGKGIHHDVHGPWGMGPFGAGGFDDIEAWRAYWEGDDALFRSEVGMPGASSSESFARFSGGLPAFPPTGALWVHGSGWWTQWERFEPQLAGKSPEEGLAEYIRLTQQLQANAYAIAAAACKRRFPRCGGFIIWMGHDCYPCPANNSVIDFLRNPKPAYYALQRVFRSGSTEMNKAGLESPAL